MTHSNPTCGQVLPSKWLDRAPNESGNCNKSAATYIVRANVSEDTWLPDHCYPTKDVVTIPPTPSNDVEHAFLDNTELPIIEEDDVSYILFRKVGGKWAIKATKPMHLDGQPLILSHHDKGGTRRGGFRFVPEKQDGTYHLLGVGTAADDLRRVGLTNNILVYSQLSGWCNNNPNAHGLVHEWRLSTVDEDGAAVVDNADDPTTDLRMARSRWTSNKAWDICVGH